MAPGLARLPVTCLITLPELTHEGEGEKGARRIGRHGGRRRVSKMNFPPSCSLTNRAPWSEESMTLNSRIIMCSSYSNPMLKKQASDSHLALRMVTLPGETGQRGGRKPPVPSALCFFITNGHIGILVYNLVLHVPCPHRMRRRGHPIQLAVALLILNSYRGILIVYLNLADSDYISRSNWSVLINQVPSKEYDFESWKTL